MFGVDWWPCKPFHERTKLTMSLFMLVKAEYVKASASYKIQSHYKYNLYDDGYYYGSSH